MPLWVSNHLTPGLTSLTDSPLAVMMLSLLLQLLLGSTGWLFSYLTISYNAHQQCPSFLIYFLGYPYDEYFLPKLIIDLGLAIRCYSDHAGPNSAGGIETCDEGGVCSSSRIIFRWVWCGRLNAEDFSIIIFTDFVKGRRRAKNSYVETLCLKDSR